MSSNNEMYGAAEMSIAAEMRGATRMSSLTGMNRAENVTTFISC